MKKISVITIIMISMFIISCESNTTQELSAVVLNPTYTQNVQPIVTANCTGCHSGGNQYPDLDTYETLKDASINGQVLCRIDGSCGDIMPTSGAMPQATIDLIKTWAANNYPN